ncbi:hypothetical protein [Galbibacter sp. BG1]
MKRDDEVKIVAAAIVLMNSNPVNMISWIVGPTELKSGKPVPNDVHDKKPDLIKIFNNGKIG